jgi:hypothetical protein
MEGILFLIIRMTIGQIDGVLICTFPGTMPYQRWRRRGVRFVF